MQFAFLIENNEGHEQNKKARYSFEEDGLQEICVVNIRDENIDKNKVNIVMNYSAKKLCKVKCIAVINFQNNFPEQNLQNL